VATTILAVDDSATMRKILEITFAGTDFQLVAVGTGEEAAAKLRQGGIGLVICDNSLPSDGYEVAGQLKSASPSTPLLFLSSRQNPYDAGRGSGARVDDHIDKPFDTQQLIDRAVKLASGGVSAGATAGSASAPASAGAPPQAAAAAPAPAAKSKTMAYGAAPAPAPTSGKSAGFGAGGLGTKPVATANVKPAPAQAPAAASAPPAQARPAAAPAASAALSAAATAANGQLAAKIGEMGLNQAQADAILSLSRDVIERIVWEVVPVLAETLIKEELARLTK